MLIQTDPKVEMALAAGFPLDAILLFLAVQSWLLHSQTVHELMGVGKCRYGCTATATAAASGCIAVERPEADKRQAIG